MSSTPPAAKLSVRDAHVRARQLLEKEQLDPARSIYEQLIAVDANDALAWNLLGIIDFKQRNYERALKFIDKSIALQPRTAEFHHNIGPVYRALGRFEKAEKHYRTAVELRPTYAEAYFNLSGARRFDEADPLIPLLQQQLGRGDLSQEDRCFLNFAAGKIFNDLGQYDRAFGYYQAGNASAAVSHDPRVIERTAELLVETFSKDLFEARRPQAPCSGLPVFVVGMPRSGTTLTEQILASHPQVVGAGELPDIMSIATTLPRHGSSGEPFPACVPRMPAKIFEGFGDAYLKRLAALGPGATRVVDKMPQNFLFLGLIALLLPGARVIHCRRHPLDTCLSCYFQRFRTAHEYSYDLAHLAHYYRQYLKIMEHWRRVLPLPMFELDYETLVEDQETTTRSLLAFCGLEWDPRCLNFHEDDRVVTTASNWQVRRPLNRGSLGRWRRYESHIGPLHRALEGEDG